MFARWLLAPSVALIVSVVSLRVAAEEFETPWNGVAEVHRTTAELMQEQSHGDSANHSHARPRFFDRFQRLPPNPGSPVISTWPPENNGVVPAPTSLLDTNEVNFTGATLADTGAFPPDSMGAVGPAQFIVAVNGRIRTFTKSGVADDVLDINPDVFFSSVMTPPVANNFTSDPRIRYDRLSQRWFIIIIDVPGAAGALPNRIMIAVSSGPVITASTVWSFFFFQHDLVSGGGDTGKFADYPTLGIDANALYIGVNIFATRGQGSFDNTTAFVVRKSSLLGAGPIVVTAFRGLVSNNPNVSGPYTPQGVDNFNPAATEGYIIGVDANFYGRLQLRRVSSPGGTPTISANISITIPLNGNTITVPHLGNAGGSAGNLDGLDYRLMAAHIRNGRLWTCANMAVDNNGAPNGTDTRSGIRWMELQGIATGQTPAIVQSGTLFQPSASNTTDQRHYWMGTMMTSGQGHALMGFSVAGANERINAGTARRLTNDPLGTLQAPLLYTATSVSYNPPGDSGGGGGRRWGDYSYTSVDPNDDMTMWTIQEFCDANNSYGVRVLRVLAPPPATPVSCSPSNILAGTSNVNVTVFGSVVSGSGFFDPGAGFSNRLSAAVSGSGVTINGVTYVNPTNMALSVSVAAGASAGARSLSVTNPDGQTITSATGLLTIQAVMPPSNHPPVLASIPNKVLDEQTLLTFTPIANDPDGDALTFSLLSGAPTGAAVHSTNGTFTWTPTELQGPATNTIAVRVTDNGSPSLSATQTFMVTVHEVNLPPTLAALSNHVVYAGETVSFTASASDNDLPTNTLTFTLEAGAPATANITPAGLFTWITTNSDIGPHTIGVRVTDNGVPLASDTNSFSVDVAPLPQFITITQIGTNVVLRWTALAGRDYQLQFKSNFNSAIWSNLPPVITATSNSVEQIDSVTDAQRFYRVSVLP